MQRDELTPPLGWPLRSLRHKPLYLEYAAIRNMLAPLGRDGLSQGTRQAS